MQQLVYESSFTQLLYDADYKESVHIFLPTCKQMNDEQYYVDVCSVVSKMETLNIQYLITDMREFTNPVIPEIQAQVLEFTIPRWIKMGMKKVALIMPTEFIANLSVEQMIDDAKEKTVPYDISYFDSFEKARLWLYT